MELVPHPSPGAVVAGKYRVERVLGKGGMGVVLAAKHTVLEQRYALKFILDVSDAESTERFLREARATAKLESEHVCRVTDVGTHEGAPFIVMEMLSGMDLHGRLTAFGPMVPAEAVDYVLQALDALAEAHARGIVHRDLKPSNLFLASRGDGTTIVKVLDFGISKMHDGADSVTASTHDALAIAAAAPALTQTGACMGSPPYMSPEQLVSTRDVDARCDLWAIGAILYELLTGTRAFGGGGGALFQHILAGEYAPLRSVRPDVPAALEAVVARCLAVKPEDRWSSAGELSRALIAFAPSKGKLHVARAERWSAAVNASVPPPPVPAPPASGNTPTGGIALATTRRLIAQNPRWSILSAVVLASAATALLFVGARLYRAPFAAEPPVVAATAPAAAAPPPPLAEQPPPSEIVTAAPAPPTPSAAPAKDAGEPKTKPRGKSKSGGHDAVDLGRL